jgi:hypothetical protein
MKEGGAGTAAFALPPKDAERCRRPDRARRPWVHPQPGYASDGGPRGSAHLVRRRKVRRRCPNARYRLTPSFPTALYARAVGVRPAVRALIVVHVDVIALERMAPRAVGAMITHGLPTPIADSGKHRG